MNDDLIVVWNRRLTCDIYHWTIHPLTGFICSGIYHQEKVF